MLETIFVTQERSLIDIVGPTSQWYNLVAFKNKDDAFEFIRKKKDEDANQYEFRVKALKLS